MRQPFNNPLLDSSPQLVNPRRRLAKGFPLARALANFQRSITLSCNRRLKTCSAPSPLNAKSTRGYFFFPPPQLALPIKSINQSTGCRCVCRWRRARDLMEPALTPLAALSAGSPIRSSAFRSAACQLALTPLQIAASII